MHVLITGAGGFSGSNLVAALLSLGHTVSAVCGRSRGRLDPQAFGDAPLSVIVGNLLDPLPLPRGIDAVVHAAARSPAPGIGCADMVRDNATATARLISYARDAGARTFVYLSSLSVNGRIAAGTVDEQTPIVDPGPYGITKYLGELMLREEPSLRSLSIRLPGVIGRGSVRNWLTNVLAAVHAGRTISVYNADADFNNAVHIDDLCRFVAEVLANPRWAGHDAVTVGAGGMTTVRGAVDTLIRAAGSPSSIAVVEQPRPAFVISSERARKVYAYAPMHIETMLRNFAVENRSCPSTATRENHGSA